MSIDLMHNKSLQRKIAKDAGSAIAPGTTITPKSHDTDIYETITNLTSQYSEIGTWIMKMNNYGNGEGIAHFRVPGEDVQVDESYMLDSVQILSSDWESWSEYVRAFLSNGGVIEAMAERKSYEILSCHLQISPDLKMSVVGTTRMVITQDFRLIFFLAFRRITFLSHLIRDTL